MKLFVNRLKLRMRWNIAFCTPGTAFRTFAVFLHKRRKAAVELGVDATTAGCHWRRLGLKPHLERTSKVSLDPKFVGGLEDIVGLYMSPPENALVPGCDGKSQVQALDRTQPGLPLKKSRAGTMAHDDKHNGTTTLFAALDVLDSTVIGLYQQRHRHTEWLKFLRQVDQETTKGKTLYLIVDNDAAHKHPKVQAWLEKHPRFIMHSTPTPASWLNRPTHSELLAKQRNHINGIGNFGLTRSVICVGSMVFHESISICI